jgi:hypothetical protein
MDILVKNVSTAGKTEAEMAAILAQAGTLFHGCEVAFVNAEAKAVGFEQQLAKELHAALASIKNLLGLKPSTPPAAVVVAVQVAATPAVIDAVAASPDVAAAVAAVPPVAPVAPSPDAPAASPPVASPVTP